MNGCQGYLCIGSGADRAAALKVVGQYEMDEAFIFEALECRDKVTYVSCSTS